MTTWNEWSKESGITGTPDANDDAIRMAEWAIMNGDILAWTCARILGIIPELSTSDPTAPSLDLQFENGTSVAYERVHLATSADGIINQSPDHRDADEE